MGIVSPNTKKEQLTPYFKQKSNKETLTPFSRVLWLQSSGGLWCNTSPATPTTEPHDGPKNDTHPHHAVRRLKIQKQTTAAAAVLWHTLHKDCMYCIWNCFHCLQPSLFVCPTFREYKNSTLLNSGRIQRWQNEKWLLEFGFPTNSKINNTLHSPETILHIRNMHSSHFFVAKWFQFRDGWWRSRKHRSVQYQGCNLWKTCNKNK